MKKIQKATIALLTVASLVTTPLLAVVETTDNVTEQPATETAQDVAAYEDAVQLGYCAPFFLGVLGSAAVVGGIIAILIDSSSAHAHAHS